MFLLLLLACTKAPSDDTVETEETHETQDSAPDAAIALEIVATGLSSPLLATAPAGDARLFVVEQRGRVVIVADGDVAATPFVDLGSVVSQAGSERGLLGLAFHPQYATNGRFFVNYTRQGDGATVVAELGVSADPDVAAPDLRTLLVIDQPYENHNGGHMTFGPDGYLYIATGDGGLSGDPLDAAQDLTSHLGKLLRIDVDTGDPYGIPPGNPFTGEGQKPEIWAYGLRNPWRFSFDRQTGALFIGDVGQNRYEEIDYVEAPVGGEDYGWDDVEGLHCYEQGCDPTGTVLPVLEYAHNVGCSVTGGFAYRGSVPDLQGIYLYSDFCRSFIKTWRPSDGAAGDLTELLDGGRGLLHGVSSFGEDAAGELYVVSYGNGMVLRIVAGS